MTNAMHEGAEHGAEKRIRVAVNAATGSHGRFSQFTGRQTLEISLATLRAALEGNEQARDQIVTTLAQAHPRHPFKSWAGPSGGDVCEISLADLRAFVGAS